ncbi:MAG TPA: CoA-binding protein [Armatimonadota bacterium]|jgi:hypothetical protein
MPTIQDAAREFLAQKRIAVAGVSRKGDAAANAIYRKLRAAGHEVFAVNPNADSVEGDTCFRSLSAIPGAVDAVVIATPRAAAEGLVRQCAANGVRRVWMHSSFGHGSVDEGAVRLAQELGLAVIPGSCPMMYCEPVDGFHRCLRWVLRVSGRQPAPLEQAGKGEPDGQ